MLEVEGLGKNTLHMEVALEYSCISGPFGDRYFAQLGFTVLGARVCFPSCRLITCIHLAVAASIVGIRLWGMLCNTLCKGFAGITLVEIGPVLHFQNPIQKT